LEELLLEYPGTLLLVSHDRVFLNNVVTSTIVLEGGGLINEYAGGYDDWLNQQKITLLPEAIKTRPVKEIIRVKKPVVARKLTAKEQREMDNFPSVIEKIETEQKELYALLADFNFYQNDPALVQKTKTRSEFLSIELEKAYQRWEYLEELSK
ncbi:MAG: ABC transporter ATP-binding protein, partial [Candidatus Omnitrophica bacterium]|nr:ABC transporter ATP-binding protein [Candidatus Omnitrophota bacterium]